jgi:cation diffusion facilitator CzcD-associated flavoprotein CzcO
MIPEWPGLDPYRGRLIHSDGYRSGAEYRGRDVLVVGLGNSGAEIAADLAQDGARRVSVAVRTPPPITRRDVLGIPIQLLGILGSFLPASVGDRLGSVLRRLGTGNLSRYGLGPAEWGPFSARRPPVIDVGFLGELRSGRIEILPALERLTEDAVVFVGRREERFDAVIAATGFRSRVPELLGLAATPDDEHSSRNGPPTHLPQGVHAVGFRESVRGVLFETRRDSLRLARVIAREVAARGSSPAR